jgi:hypothetical protein
VGLIEKLLYNNGMYSETCTIGLIGYAQIGIDYFILLAVGQVTLKSLREVSLYSNKH